MVTVTGSVVTADGIRLPASGTATIVVPATVMFGVDAAPADRTSHLNLFPGAKIVSAFASPGSGLPLPPTLPAGVILHQRFKDPVTSTLVNSWLAAIHRPTWVTWHHEPTTADDPTVHKAGQVLLRQLINAHPNGHWVSLVGNFMLYQVREAGLRWQDYWATMPDGSPAAHVIGFDCYVNQAKPTLEDPASFFSVPLAAAREAGVLLSISELGAVVTTAPGRTAAKHATWLGSCVTYLRAQPEVRAACYWCNTGSQGDFHLEHNMPGSLAVWRGACAAQ